MSALKLACIFLPGTPPPPPPFGLLQAQILNTVGSVPLSYPSSPPFRNSYIVSTQNWGLAGSLGMAPKNRGGGEGPLCQHPTLLNPLLSDSCLIHSPKTTLLEFSKPMTSQPRGRCTSLFEPPHCCRMPLPSPITACDESSPGPQPHAISPWRTHYAIDLHLCKDECLLPPKPDHHLRFPQILTLSSPGQGGAWRENYVPFHTANDTLHHLQGCLASGLTHYVCDGYYVG